MKNFVPSKQDKYCISYFKYNKIAFFFWRLLTAYSMYIIGKWYNTTYKCHIDRVFGEHMALTSVQLELIKGHGG